MLYNLGPFRPRFGELGRKVRPFYFREFGITSHYFQRAGEKLLKKSLGSWGALLEFDFPIRLLFIHINITVPLNSFRQKHAGMNILHRRRKVLNIGGGGGGGGIRILGGGGKLSAGRKLIGAPAPNQCQIITFLTLKTDDIAKLRKELKSFLLEIPSNKIKGTYIKLVHV